MSNIQKAEEAAKAAQLAARKALETRDAAVNELAAAEWRARAAKKDVHRTQEAARIAWEKWEDAWIEAAHAEELE